MNIGLIDKLDEWMADSEKVFEKALRETRRRRLTQQLTQQRKEKLKKINEKQSK